MNKFWKKIPAIVRAIIVGMLIQIVGVMPLFFLIQKNIEIMPSFPWALLVGLVFIWFFWKFLTGQKFPFNSSVKRKELSRTDKIPLTKVKLAYIAGFTLSVTLISFALLSYQFTEMPLQQVELLQALKKIPIWTSIPLLFIASLITGVVEEMAFRGYMQKIIEIRHKAYVAISIVALMFTIAHALPLIIWPLFFVGALGWGVLAYLLKSIIPGVIYHFLVDFVFFIWAMFNLDTLSKILEYNVFKDGINSLFISLISVSLTTPYP